MDYFDTNLKLSDEEIQLKEEARKFAMNVLRPVSKELDKMTAEEAIAQGSPFWDYLKKAYELGYHKALIPEYYGGMGLSPLQTHLVFEELAVGSMGLALYTSLVCFPFFMVCMTGDDRLIDEYVRPFCACTDGSIRGCWLGTEPDRGSDILAFAEPFFRSPAIKASLKAELKGDEYVINGQKSAWVSGGTIGTHALTHLQIDPSMGLAGGGVCMIPLDQPGVSKGKPLEKIGQRDLNQGEIFFDNVKIPKSYMFAEPDYYVEMFDLILATANTCMAIWCTGLARAAFEEALVYCRERVQGGVDTTLTKHYSIRQKLCRMFSRVEMCRAYSRSNINLNFAINPPMIEYAIAAKTMCSEIAFKNAHDAVQLLGGNGLTKEYMTEKLFRDARATLIEDGTTESLEAYGGHLISETYPRPRLD